MAAIWLANYLHFESIKILYKEHTMFFSFVLQNLLQ